MLEEATTLELLEEITRRSEVFIAFVHSVPGEHRTAIITEGRALEIVGAVNMLYDHISERFGLNEEGEIDSDEDD